MFVSPSRVAYMYYEMGMTQQQVAKEVGISRIQVSRMLQQARQDGTVRISIKYDGFYPVLESALEERHPDVTFVVSDSLDGTDRAIKRSVGAAAADYLTRRLSDGMVVAVGWGTTLKALDHGPTDADKDLTFVPLVGGQAGAGLDVHANSVAELLARKLGGRAERIFAPAVADTREERDQFVKSMPLRETLARAATADAVVFSVGSPFARTTTIDKIGYFTDDEVEQLRNENASCDVISIRYFDSTGREVGQELSKRTVSITFEQLSNIPLKICVAGGADKHEAVRIALNLGIIDVLVTDEQTARFLTG